MKPIHSRLLAALLSGLLVATSATAVHNNLGTEALSGDFVLDLDGSFSSASPPFNGAVLQLVAAQVGTLSFDGTGQVWGEATLAFHNPSVPMTIRSRKALVGTYSVQPQGRVLINVDEFNLSDDGQQGSQRTSSFALDCYVVQHQQLAQCIMHTLISYQQGPAPKELPVTMSGQLKRQR